MPIDYSKFASIGDDEEDDEEATWREEPREPPPEEVLEDVVSMSMYWAARRDKSATEETSWLPAFSFGVEEVGVVNDRQARDWLFRAGVDGPESWRELWRLEKGTGLTRAYPEEAETKRCSVVRDVRLEPKWQWERPASGSASKPCRTCCCPRCGGPDDDAEEERDDSAAAAEDDAMEVEGDGDDGRGVEKETQKRTTKSAGASAFECVTCWKCKRYFDARCVAGFSLAAAGTNLVSVSTARGPRHAAADLEAFRPWYSNEMRTKMLEESASLIREKFPLASVWRLSPMGDPLKVPDPLVEWGYCPSCNAQLGATALPKAALAAVAKKVFLGADAASIARAFATSTEIGDATWVKRAVAREAGCALAAASKTLRDVVFKPDMDVDDRKAARVAIFCCTRALVAVNYLRSVETPRVDAWTADAYFRAHCARGFLERGLFLARDLGHSMASTNRYLGTLESLFERHARYRLAPRVQCPNLEPTDLCLDGSLKSAAAAGSLKSPAIVWLSKDAAETFEVLSDDAFARDGAPEPSVETLQADADAEHRVRKLWFADDEPYSVPPPDPEKRTSGRVAKLAMVYDVRWLMRSDIAALAFWLSDVVPRRTEESDPDAPCKRLYYAPRGFTFQPSTHPVQIPGARDSAVFKGATVTNGLLAYNVLFRVGRVLGKIYLYLSLFPGHGGPGNPALDMAVLALAKTAVDRVIDLLHDDRRNVLEPDWNVLGTHLRDDDDALKRPPLDPPDPTDASSSPHAPASSSGPDDTHQSSESSSSSKKRTLDDLAPVPALSSAGSTVDDIFFSSPQPPSSSSSSIGGNQGQIQLLDDTCQPAAKLHKPSSPSLVHPSYSSS